jgi:hypothetical protein
VIATTGLAASVQVRLVRHAKALGMDPNLVFARFAAERLLYRLSRSPHAERFVLKGALPHARWLGEPSVPRRGFALAISRSRWKIFAVCDVEAEPDGVEQRLYDPRKRSAGR